MHGGSPKAGFTQSATEALMRLWFADEADRQRRARRRHEHGRPGRESLRARWLPTRSTSRWIGHTEAGDHD